MKKDPKQIITPFAFSVNPDVLGLPLATPKRRLAALLVDLLIASILTSLGNFILAIAVTIMIFWVAVRTRSDNTFKNLLRYAGAAFASIFVFVISLAVLETFEPSSSTDVPDGITAIDGTETIDWGEFGSQMATMDYSDPDAIEEGLEKIVEQFDFETNNTDFTPFLSQIDENFSSKLVDFNKSIEENDSLSVETLRSELAKIIASNEINALDDEVDLLEDQVDVLSEENADLTDQIENPSLYQSLKKSSRMLGLSLGWIGIYFIATIAYFKGQTLGKRLLKIRVIRLNNKPIGLFFSFERFGGYAAGFATGLIGFFQMFWDPNRQAIHDKIAGTVVIDLRKSKMDATAEMREEILERENLLLQMP